MTGTPIIHWSRKERINAIYRGLFDLQAAVGFKDVGIWPFGKTVPDAAQIEYAAQSGNKQHKTAVAKWAKRMFLTWQFNWCDRFFARRPDAFVVIWNGIKGHRRVLADAATARGMPVIYFEEAPLPARVTIDFAGVNFGSSLPRRIGFYHDWLAQSGVAPDRWRDLRSQLVPRKADRDDVGQGASDAALGAEKFIFCPLQVPGDSQITIYGDWITSVDHMIDELARAAQALPDGWHLRIKEHPSARISFGEKLAALAGPKFRVDNSTDTFAQVSAARAVVNVNSSVGLQAFFFDKPVLVLGEAFYAFDHLAHKVSDAQELAQVLSAPEKLAFDAGARDAFMSYLDAAYYPRVAAVIDGSFGLADLVARDKLRDQILTRGAG
ncbi:Capsule polysaccharide biosynthesis protein [Aquimixticola soesokkakensis]|uniref:Capsule polysaccharide biosynthesis protein n=2 Tax=Aquimixticola soesokkakensis TaxID=1519096 RepID=A0A1Y5TPE7_9RHOB|nr:Capsule polysaccharide biosynthesis protein [Aquimixticola soesokkakensis]